MEEPHRELEWFCIGIISISRADIHLMIGYHNRHLNIILPSLPGVKWSKQVVKNLVGSVYFTIAVPKKR
jgi:hypothetical protein